MNNGTMTCIFGWNFIHVDPLEIHLKPVVQVSEAKKNDPDDFWACVYTHHANHQN